MNTQYLARQESETQSPTGDIFLSKDLCTLELVPLCILEIMQDLPRQRRISLLAKTALSAAVLEWDDLVQRGEVKSYGTELGVFVSDKSCLLEERKQRNETADKIVAIEIFKYQAAGYRSKQGLIRQTANSIGSTLLGKMTENESVDIGLHRYTSLKGPYDFTFFCRVNEEQPLTLFDWDGMTDDTSFSHATFRDQLVLISDVLVNNGDESAQSTLSIQTT
jgi:hypothetical protein